MCQMLQDGKELVNDQPLTLSTALAASRLVFVTVSSQAEFENVSGVTGWDRA